MFIVLIDSGDYEFAAIGTFDSRDNAERFIHSDVPAVHGPVVVEMLTPERWAEEEAAL